MAAVTSASVEELSKRATGLPLLSYRTMGNNGGVGRKTERSKADSKHTGDIGHEGQVRCVLSMAGGTETAIHAFRVREGNAQAARTQEGRKGYAHPSSLDRKGTDRHWQASRYEKDGRRRATSVASRLDCTAFAAASTGVPASPSSLCHCRRPLGKRTPARKVPPTVPGEGGLAHRKQRVRLGPVDGRLGRNEHAGRAGGDKRLDLLIGARLLPTRANHKRIYDKGRGAQRRRQHSTAMNEGGRSAGSSGAGAARIQPGTQTMHPRQGGWTMATGASTRGSWQRTNVHPKGVAGHSHDRQRVPILGKQVLHHLVARSGIPTLTGNVHNKSRAASQRQLPAIDVHDAAKVGQRGPGHPGRPAAGGDGGPTSRGRTTEGGEAAQDRGDSGNGGGEKGHSALTGSRSTGEGSGYNGVCRSRGERTQRVVDDADVRVEDRDADHAAACPSLGCTTFGTCFLKSQSTAR